MTSTSYPGMPEALVADWKAIRSSVAELQLFWRFHVRFCGNHDDVAMMEDILLCPYVVLRKALLFTIVIQIRALLDPAETRKRGATLANLSLRRLVQLVEPHDSALHVKLTTLLDGIDTHCEPIGQWGNKRVGHADWLTAQSQQKLPEVTEHEFETALAMMLDLLRQIHAHFYGPNVPLDLPQLIDGADKLLDYIRKGRQAEIAEIEAIL